MTRRYDYLLHTDASPLASRLRRPAAFIIATARSCYIDSILDRGLRDILECYFGRGFGPGELIGYIFS